MADVFTKVRWDYAQSLAFNPLWNISPDRKAIMDKLRAKDNEKAITMAQRWLESCPADAEMYFILAVTLEMAGRGGEAVAPYACYYGLLASIRASGDGLSPKNPIKVISVSEEYTLLRRLRLKVKSQAVTKDQQDVMTCEDASGKEIVYYFDVSHSMGWMENNMSGKAKTEAEE